MSRLQHANFAKTIAILRVSNLSNKDAHIIMGYYNPYSLGGSKEQQKIWYISQYKRIQQNLLSIYKNSPLYKEIELWKQSPYGKKRCGNNLTNNLNDIKYWGISQLHELGCIERWFKETPKEIQHK